MKNIKIFLGIVINLVLSVLIGTGMLFLAFCLPLSSIEKHVTSSAQTIFEEQTYPVLSEDFSSTLDNWTDSTMLLEAANDLKGTTLQRAMKVSRHSFVSIPNPVEVLIRHYVWGEEFDTSFPYPRYWHGFLIFLKPLLEIFDLSQIRVLNGLGQVILFILTAWLLVKKKKEFYLIPWSLGYLMLMPLVLAKSLQYSSCYYIFMIGALVLLLLPKDKLRRLAPFIFLNIGIALAYFDFLTYPIATFGAPMVVYLMLTEETTLNEKTVDGLKNGIMWCIGYGGMWAAKWVLASKILDRDVIADGISQFTERTSSMSFGYEISKVQTIMDNYKEFFRTPVAYIAAVCLFYLVLSTIKNWKKISRQSKESFLLYLVVALAPIVWYCFATNHSAIHVFFTNKACIVSFLAIMFGLISLSQNATNEVKADGQDSSSDSVL